MRQRVAVWLAVALALLTVIGVVGLIAGGSCGCAVSNYACAVQPCPSSDLLWTAFVFVGAFGGSLALSAAMLMRHNERLRAYQEAQPPVSAEAAPTPFVSRSAIGPWPSQTPRP